MGTKADTTRYRFSKQELLDALLSAELPTLTVNDIVDIRVDGDDTSYFIIDTAEQTPETL